MLWIHVYLKKFLFIAKDSSLLKNIANHKSPFFSLLWLENKPGIFWRFFFWFKQLLDWGQEQRESKMTVLCLLITIILISYMIIHYIIIKLLIMDNHPSQNRKWNSSFGYFHLFSFTLPQSYSSFTPIKKSYKICLTKWFKHIRWFFEQVNNLAKTILSEWKKSEWRTTNTVSPLSFLLSPLSSLLSPLSSLLSPLSSLLSPSLSIF